MDKIDEIENAWLLTVEEAKRVLNLGSLSDMLILCGNRIELWSRHHLNFRLIRGTDYWCIGYNENGNFLLITPSVKNELDRLSNK